MLKNYLTIALRTLRRHKGYAFINITGLAVGMVCCLVIGLYVQDELSYDRFHQHADRTYRLLLEPEGGSRARLGVTGRGRRPGPGPESTG